MYNFFNRNLKEAFYDKISLPKLSESDYGTAIMETLDKSRNFVVVLSDMEYLKSHWVGLEMRTFKAEMNEGRKEDANFILVVTDSVFDQIISSNKRILPIQYRDCEIMRVREYKSRILQYL